MFRILGMLVHTNNIVSMKNYVNQPLDPLFVLLIRKLVEQTATEADLRPSFYFAMKLPGREIVLRFRFLELVSMKCQVEALSIEGKPVEIDGTLLIAAQPAFSQFALAGQTMLIGSETVQTVYAADIYGGITVLFQLRERHAATYKGDQVFGRWIVTPHFDRA